MQVEQKHIPIGLEKFKSLLKQHFGGRFSGLTLFGSYALHQAREDSDVDLLLVLKNHSTEKDDYLEVLPFISGFLLETGLFISLVIKSEQELIRQKEGLLKNIEAEGIRL